MTTKYTCDRRGCNKQVGQWYREPSPTGDWEYALCKEHADEYISEGRILKRCPAPKLKDTDDLGLVE